MSPTTDWLAARTSGAPPELRARVAAWVAEVGTLPADPMTLAEAGRRALASAIAHGTGRAVALDLLAADALVTLALQAQAERAPGGLAAFARELREVGTADS